MTTEPITESHDHRLQMQIEAGPPTSNPATEAFRIQFNGWQMATIENEAALCGMDCLDGVLLTRRLAACWNACKGIPTEALEAGAVADLARTLADLLEEIPRHIGRRDVRKHYSLLVAERYAGDAIRKLKVPEPATD